MPALPQISGISDGASLDEGASIEITVETGNDADVLNVELFLNDALVRRENLAPFTWNVSSKNQVDEALQNLSAGDYTLKAVLTRLDGTMPEQLIRFRVAAALDINSEIQQLMTQAGVSCANSSCHDATPGQARIDLVSGSLEDIAARMVGHKSGNSACGDELIIDPMDRDNSLFLRLINVNSGDQCMAKMPFGQQGVSEEHYERFVAWVDKLIELAPPINIEPEVPSEIIPQALNKSDAFSIANYVKTLMLGSAVTAEEYSALTAGGAFDQTEYELLLDKWMSDAAFQQKLMRMLRLLLQQNEIPIENTNYYRQNGGLGYAPDAPVDTSRAKANLDLMFVRTALRIINDDDDFREIITTREWEVTTMALAAMARADRGDIWENNKEFWLRSMPGVVDSDYDDWRTVTMVQSDSMAAYELSESFIGSMRSIPEGGEFHSLAPRVGFFNSPAFIFGWQTNTSNQFRLPTNQALIVATAKSFEAGDVTPVNHREGIAAEHALPGTDCYSCHERMDPMRNIYMKYYKDRDTRARENIGDDKPDFAFHGLSQQISTMDEFAQTLATHQDFAFAWAAKVCQYFTSVECDQRYPVHVQELADAFVASGYSFKTLLMGLFRSPLVLYGVTDNSTMLISVMRRDHYCFAMDKRLEDIRGLRNIDNSQKLCENTRYLPKQMMALIPNDTYSRGRISLLQPALLDPFYLKSIEALCAEQDWRLIGNTSNGRTFNRDQVEQTLDDFTQHILGVPGSHENYQAARDALQRSYQLARATPECASPADVDINHGGNPSCGMALNAQQSMEVLWRMVCSAPANVGVGMGF